jgi:hypothetical protein
VLREYAHTSASNLELREGMTFDDWLGVGSQIARISNASAWWLGDWLLYGERAYGERYKTALDATQLGYQTLRNYAWVARRFEKARRREHLSFLHHAEVASLPEADQDLWLERTERLRWSGKELRRRLRAEARPALRSSEAPDALEVTLRVPVTTDRERRWREAAAAAEKELVDWIATAADRAADDALLPGDSGGAAGPRQCDAVPGPRPANRSARRRQLSVTR